MMILRAALLAVRLNNQPMGVIYVGLSDDQRAKGAGLNPAAACGAVGMGG
jgi:hypothetical protein